MHPPPEQPREHLFYFRRRFHPARKPLSGLFIAPPWIDVVLLLLLFHLMQSAFVVQPGVRLDLPVAAQAHHLGYGDLVVTLPQEGMYFFNDERMTPDGLSVALAAAARRHPEAALLIEADARISHQALLDVYAMAVAAGVREVFLATRSPVVP